MLISVITVCYNNLQELKLTVDSVLKQDYKEIEFIIIDGGSTDGTKVYLESISNQFAFWVSEPDEGVYNAMNKGIDQASGAYLLFLNSGDWLVDSEVLSSFVSLKPQEDLVYGDTLLRENGKEHTLNMPDNLGVGTALTHTINHQSVFFNRRLFEDGSRYDCSYKIVADWVFMNHCVIEKKCSTRHIDLVVPSYDVHGISDNKELRIAERDRYLSENFNQEFLRLLKDYQSLLTQYTGLKQSKAVTISSGIKKTIKSISSKSKK